MMKRYSIIWAVFAIGVVLFFSGCDKNYYNPDEVEHTLIAPDTIYLNTPVTLKGTVNRPLDIRVYWEAINDEHYIGILKSASDSLVWTPVDMEEGPYLFMTMVNVKAKRGGEYGLVAGWSVFVKKMPEE